MCTLSRHAPLLILLACIAALGSAFLAQYGFGLRPCILCLYQRIPYAISILLALLALRTRNPRTRDILIGLCAALFAINAGIAAYQVGIENFWWAGFSGCSGTGAALPDSPDALLQSLSQPLPVRCDDVPFELFGVSLAGANLGLSSLLALFAAFSAAGCRRR